MTYFNRLSIGVTHGLLLIVHIYSEYARAVDLISIIHFTWPDGCCWWCWEEGGCTGSVKTPTSPTNITTTHTQPPYTQWIIHPTNTSHVLPAIAHYCCCCYHYYHLNSLWDCLKEGLLWLQYKGCIADKLARSGIDHCWPDSVTIAASIHIGVSIQAREKGSGTFILGEL